MINSIFSIGLQEEEKMDKYTAGLILGVLSAGLTLQAHAQGLSPSEAKGTVPMIFE